MKHLSLWPSFSPLVKGAILQEASLEEIDEGSYPQIVFDLSGEHFSDNQRVQSLHKFRSAIADLDVDEDVLLSHGFDTTGQLTEPKFQVWARSHYRRAALLQAALPSSPPSSPDTHTQTAAEDGGPGGGGDRTEASADAPEQAVEEEKHEAAAEPPEQAVEEEKHEAAADAPEQTVEGEKHEAATVTPDQAVGEEGMGEDGMGEEGMGEEGIGEEGIGEEGGVPDEPTSEEGQGRDASVQVGNTGADGGSGNPGDEEMPSWLQTPQPPPLHTMRTSFQTEEGTVVFEVYGVFPPSLIRHLASQRTSLYTIDEDTVRLYMRSGRVCANSFWVEDEQSTFEGIYRLQRHNMTPPISHAMRLRLHHMRMRERR